MKNEGIQNLSLLKLKLGVIEILLKERKKERKKEKEMGIIDGMMDRQRQKKSTSTSTSTSTSSSLLIGAPLESKKARDDCTLEGAKAGAKAAVIAGVVTAVPTLLGCRLNPWAKANLNYTAQALIISAASIAAYFITADKTILDCARRNAKYDRS